MESEDDSKVDPERFKQSVYDNDLDMEENFNNINSASMILNKTDPVEMKQPRKIRR